MSSVGSPGSPKEMYFIIKGYYPQWPYLSSEGEHLSELTGNHGEVCSFEFGGLFQLEFAAAKIPRSDACC